MRKGRKNELLVHCYLHSSREFSRQIGLLETNMEYLPRKHQFIKSNASADSQGRCFDTSRNDEDVTVSDQTLRARVPEVIQIVGRKIFDKCIVSNGDYFVGDRRNFINVLKKQILNFFGSFSYFSYFLVIIYFICFCCFLFIY